MMTLAGDRTMLRSMDGRYAVNFNQGGVAVATKTVKPLAETKDWFVKTIVPKRTAAAGFSGNRLWKSPIALVRGNSEDPNGLCGDTSAFVVEAFYDEFDNYTTSDGYLIGLVLWEGKFSNHIANVMLVKGKVGPEIYSWSSTTHAAVSKTPTTSSYSSGDLLRLNVYDLYYKRATTVEAWWKDLDSGMGGTLKIGQLSSISD
ncbi:MAG: hypothetical protein ABJD97_10635 [Betaproteobacteria bacterium]